MLNRRRFVVALSAVPLAASTSSVTLHALVAPALPSYRCLSSGEAAALGIAAKDTRVFELRTYFGLSTKNARAITKFFERAGIPAIKAGNASWWIPFGTMSEREQAWNSVHAHPAWQAVRSTFSSYEFSLFRV